MSKKCRICEKIKTHPLLCSSWIKIFTLRFLRNFEVFYMGPKFDLFSKIAFLVTSVFDHSSTSSFLLWFTLTHKKHIHAIHHFFANLIPVLLRTVSLL